ncbi:hypothetical protein A5888_000453 [Enterococcus sp. 9E7_DIV0242]|uniref:Uncharacterized protein n=1 Tax=Candidatus Enterococcus clewellii TaxID=1834193 RepID=A0AAQ3VSS3_9ENTE
MLRVREFIYVPDSFFDPSVGLASDLNQLRNKKTIEGGYEKPETVGYRRMEHLIKIQMGLSLVFIVILI